MSEEVRAEAARLAHRLEGARDRLVGTATATTTAQSRTTTTTELDDDEVRALLTPAIDRVALLAQLARSLADGTLSDESAEEAARAIAATQPFRRAR